MYVCICLIHLSVELSPNPPVHMRYACYTLRCETWPHVHTALRMRHVCYTLRYETWPHVLTASHSTN